MSTGLGSDSMAKTARAQSLAMIGHDWQQSARPVKVAASRHADES